MPVYRLDLAYDGSRFHGYAKQPRVRTVQGELEAALRVHVGDVETGVAGRTDKGVHAAGQVVSFETDADVDPRRVLRSLNGRLGPEISALDLRLAPDGFHARFSALARAYRYLVLDREAPDPFLARTSWHRPGPLDDTLMASCVTHLVGEHDFASFCKHSATLPSVRRLDEITWRRVGDLVELWVVASSFCHQMVRSIVSVSVDVGRGKLEPDEMRRILEARDRRAGRGAAPAHGLTLVGVAYEKEPAPW